MCILEKIHILFILFMSIYKIIFFICLIYTIYKMDSQINIMYLIIITIILFLIYYFLTFTKEKFEQISCKNKECSQQAINNRQLYYIFNGIKTIR